MAQTPAPAAPAFTFALKGFVSMSAAYQSGGFGLSPGQQSLLSNTNTTSTTSVQDKETLTFDVRQSRFNFSVKGPQVLMGATPTGVFEIDFYGGNTGGNYGNVSILPRLRVAYSELNWGAHKLQFGQQNDLTFAMAPTSLSHIGFPLGYFTGNIGWRRPGIFGYHTFALPSDLKLEAAWEVGRSQWADGTTVPAVGGFTAGEASGGPAVQGRVTVNYSKYLTAFAAAHWSQADLSGYGATGGGGSLGTTHQIKTVAYNGGLKLTVPLQGAMGLTVQGTGFAGTNVQPLIANLSTTFRLGNQDNPDVGSMGWWAQAGFNLTKEFSLWAFYGMQSIDKTEFVRAFPAGSAYENATTNVQAIYRDGGYGLSVEWINFATKYALTTDTTANKILTNQTSKSDQYMVTANYFF